MSPQKAASGSISSTDTPPKRVLIAVGGDHVVGRRILAGVADYADHHQKWQHYLELSPRDTWVAHQEVDGIIAGEESYWLLRNQTRQDLPVIKVTGAPLDESEPTVFVDNHAVGAMGANYLADLGLRELAFFSMNTAYAEHRADGFAQACQDRQIRCTIINSDRAEDRYDLRGELAKLPTPIGVMAATDRLGLEVSRACHVLGRRIPDDVAVMGVDNELEICRLVDPPLTSIDHGSQRIGYEAARLLDMWLTTGQRPQPVRVQPIRVIPRQSTDLLAISDPDLVAAIRFIRARFGDAIKVNDVLRHVAMSRRSLEMHFRSTLGRSIHDEIMRVRIEHAKSLLLASEWSMPYIADECGFALASQFSFVFRRETGETPLAFRKRLRGGLKPA